MSIRQLESKTTIPEGEPSHPKSDETWLGNAIRQLQGLDFTDIWGRLLRGHDLEKLPSSKALEYYQSVKREPGRTARETELDGKKVIVIAYETKRRDDVVVRLFGIDGKNLHDSEGHKLGKGRINIGQAADWSE